MQGLCRELIVKPIGAPFPYVSGDGVETVTIGWKAVDGAASRVAVFGGVVDWELPLPDVAEVFSFRGEFVAPGVELLFKTAASGVLPLGLGRERL